MEKFALNVTKETKSFRTLSTHESQSLAKKKIGKIACTTIDVKVTRLFFSKKRMQRRKQNGRFNAKLNIFFYSFYLENYFHKLELNKMIKIFVFSFVEQKFEWNYFGKNNKYNI